MSSAKKFLDPLNLFGLNPGPTPPPPATAPDPEATRKAETLRRQRMASSGRSSTVLTGGSSKLG